MPRVKRSIRFKQKLCLRNKAADRAAKFAKPSKLPLEVGDPNDSAATAALHPLKMADNDEPSNGLGNRLSLCAFPRSNGAAVEGSGAGEISYLVHGNVLQSMIASSCCLGCGSHLELRHLGTHMDAGVTVYCRTCDKVVFEEPTPTVKHRDGSNSKFTEGEVALVYATLTDGTGFAGCSQVLRSWNMCSIDPNRYSCIQQFLLEHITAFMEDMHPCLLQGLRAAYAQLHGYNVTDSPEVIDICVSSDWIWLTQGPHSHVGATFVVDTLTGFVVDFEVLSNCCEVCNKQQSSLSQEAFAAWQQSHKNFEGNSSAMEAEGAVRIWQRSQTFGLRYTTFVGNGDSSAFNSVCALNNGCGPYVDATGVSVPVIKEEYVNHVQKRLGIRLHSLKKDLVPHVTSSGKNVFRNAGKCILTDADIDRLTKHYGQNIRSAGSGTTTKALQTTIMAAYYHASSTDEHPRHEHCSQNGCFWKKAKAEGMAPESHNMKNLDLAMVAHDRDILSKIRKVYLDLTAPELLSRCLSKATQSANESLQSKLRARVLKMRDAQRPQILFAACDLVLEHNFGVHHGNILIKLGIMSDPILQKPEPLGTKLKQYPIKCGLEDTDDWEYKPRPTASRRTTQRRTTPEPEQLVARPRRYSTDCKCYTDSQAEADDQPRWNPRRTITRRTNPELEQLNTRLKRYGINCRCGGSDSQAVMDNSNQPSLLCPPGAFQEQLCPGKRKQSLRNVDAANTIGKSPEHIFIKEEVANGELEDNDVKVEPFDWERELQDSQSRSPSELICKIEKMSAADIDSAKEEIKRVSKERIPRPSSSTFSSGTSNLTASQDPECSPYIVPAVYTIGQTPESIFIKEEVANVELHCNDVKVEHCDR